jgi:hypothetical protein
MIDWPSTLPKGTKAHIYWPFMSASGVIALSARLYGGSFLSSEDANTLVFNAVPGGITYVPIPALQMTAGTDTPPAGVQTFAAS